MSNESRDVLVGGRERAGGVVLGTHSAEGAAPTFPGLAPVSHRLTDLSRHVAELEKAEYEHAQVRATLLINFGDTTHNRYGFTVEDSGRTIDLLVAVLTQLTKGVGACSDPAKS